MERSHRKTSKLTEKLVEADLITDLKSIELLKLIIKKLNNMPTIEQYNAAFARVDAALVTIEANTGTHETGGLSLADQDAVLAKAESVATEAERIAAIAPQA